MIKVKRLVKMSEASPAQWGGITDDNRQIFVHYRYGQLEVYLGSEGDMSDFEFAGLTNSLTFSVRHGEKFDGTLDYTELNALWAGIVEFPESESEVINWQEDVDIL
jgi:hypothetical protein